MQVDSLFAAIDSLKLPAALLVFGGIYYMKFRNLEKTVKAMNIAKEDKTVVAQLALDFKGLSGKVKDFTDKANQRFRVHELTIVALAPEDQKHEVIADLKGD